MDERLRDLGRRLDDLDLPAVIVVDGRVGYANPKARARGLQDLDPAERLDGARSVPVGDGAAVLVGGRVQAQIAAEEIEEWVAELELDG